MKINAQSLRDAKRLFSRLKHLRCTLPVLNHLLLTAGKDGIHLAATDLNHWIETRLTDQPSTPVSFLIPPSAMEAACRADKGTDVTIALEENANRRELLLTLQTGGIISTSRHPTLDPAEMPQRPTCKGTTTDLPIATLQGLADIAGCASTDPTRYILNGVYFTPEEGGRLVATDGRRLACTLATVPEQAFILPSTACHILAHADFLKSPSRLTWIHDKDPEKCRVALQCGNHLLISQPIAGHYPNYQQVIPRHTDHRIVIPPSHLAGVIRWLRALGKTQCSVRLDAEGDTLCLLHQEAGAETTSLEVPAEIDGNPPLIAFNPRFLADALEQGNTLCLSDEMNPGLFRHPTGRFSVLMPMRVTMDAPRKSHAPQTAITTQAAA